MAVRNLPQIPHPSSRQGRNPSSLSVDGKCGLELALRRSKTFDSFSGFNSRRTSKFDVKLTADDLADAIPKLKSAQLRSIFKSQDNKVSKDVLHRSLNTTFGYVPESEYNQFLKKHDISDEITYDQFQRKFTRRCGSHKEFISLHKHDTLSDAFALDLLKERVKHSDFDMRSYLPPNCFETGAMILKPHLENMMERLGIRLRDGEKLWQRFDKNQIGAVRNSEFFRLLGYKERENNNNNCKTPKTAEQAVPNKVERIIEKVKRTRPALENIIDALNYTFEEAFLQLQQGLECFDFLNDGYVSRIDLKVVLEAFGMKISSIDFDIFLSRCSIRCKRGQVAYKQFLMKFWNRDESSLVHRIISNKFHAFNKAVLPDGELTAEELEAKLVDFLHNQFFKLLASFQSYDKQRIGLLTQQEFQKCIETITGRLTDKQWNDILKVKDLLQDDGLLNYETFLELFTGNPGQWNRKPLGSIQVAKVGPPPTPSQVLYLRQKAEKDLFKHREKSLPKVTKEITNLIRNRFHKVDKLWKNFDRKMTGRLSRDDFAYILRFCDVKITKEEMDCLWESFKFKGADSMVTYTALIRHFSSPDRSLPEHDMLPMETNNESEDDAKPLIEKAKTFLKEKRNEIKLQNLENIKQDDNAEKTNENQQPKLTKEQLISKLKPTMLKSWHNLKAHLKNLDQEGKMFIDRDTAIQLMNVFQFGLTTEEKFHLVECYGNHQFRYLDFLKEYMPNDYASKHFLKEKQKPPESGDKRHVTINEAIDRIRKQIIKKYKTLRRGFQKVDLKGLGILEVEEFRNVLKDCGIKVNGDDLYHLLCEFDSNMDGKVSYHEFLNRLMNV